MPSSLTQIIKHSVLLRPLVALSDVTSASLNTTWHTSGIGCFLNTLAHPLIKGLAWIANRIPAPRMILLGLLALLGLACCVLTTGPIGMLTLLLLGVGILFACRSGQNRLGRFQPSVVDILVVLMLGSVVLSTAFSSYWHTSLIGLAKLSTFFAGYLAFRLVLSQLTFEPSPQGRGISVLISLLAALALLGAAESLIGVYQYVHHIQPLATWEDPSVNPELRLVRVFGTLKPFNPNLLAGFLVPGMAAAWGLLVLWLSQKKWPLAIVSLGAAGIITIGLVLTGSRGGYLALLVVLLTLFAGVGHMLWNPSEARPMEDWQVLGKLKKLWLVTLFSSGVLAALAIIGIPSLQHRVESIFAMRDDSSTSFRLNVYQSAWRMFTDNWVLGIGPGNNTFKLVYGLYMVPGYTALSAYSVPLEIAVEQGLLGLLVFALLIGTLKFRAFWILDGAYPTERKLLVLLLGAGIAGSLVYGLFDTIWYRPAVNLPFWFLVAGFTLLTEPIAQDKDLCTKI